VPDTCVPVSLTESKCDGKDDNCNGAIDEGYAFNSDPLNCGTCGRACPTGAACALGVCTYSSIPIFCTPVSFTETVCDGKDDNCNGLIDEGFAFNTDPTNCGTCGRVCPSGAGCVLGVCTFPKVPDTCVPVSTTETKCDGKDDNCNGSIDEGFLLNSDPLNCGTCGRVCPSGAACVLGVCTYTVLPTTCVPVSLTETKCDGKDDNCNGLIDEGFNLAGDPLNCGACGRVCGAGQYCALGHCTLLVPASSCTPVAESCNYSDDNCNMVIDEGYNLLTDNLNCGLCGHACGSGQYCNNGHCALLVPMSVCTPVAESCNGIDDNCNGVIDEGYNLLTDNLNCGTCGFACGSGQTCISGKCTLTGGGGGCTAPLALCGGVCVNTQADNLNCGGCGITCGSGKTCSSGSCITTSCTAPLSLCGSACVNLLTDASNCGLCGNTCFSGQTCSSGSCK
jgi:hypothetical protein